MLYYINIKGSKGDTIVRRKKHSLILIIVLSTINLCLFNSILLVPPASSLTYQNSVNVEFTFNPTISINLSSNDLIIDNLTPGSSSDSNIITVDVSTNAGYGYYMSATAGTSTGNTDLTNGSSSSAKFTNLSSNVATLASFPDNNWGYSYSTDNGTTWISGSQGNTNTGYDGLPLDNDDSGATGVILTSTDSFTNSGSVKFKIGAKASPNQASGTYTNTVNFYAVANPEPTLGPVDCDPGKICYNANSLTTTEGTMGMQSASDGSNVTLLASNFSKQGYGFAGWSDTYDYSGNLYGLQETITVPTGTTANGLSLYAIWIKSEGSLQDSTKVAQVCNRLTVATPSTTKTLNFVSALTDERDGDTYAIAKLADGKCWMIENLRLDDSASLTLANTNNPLNDGTNVTLKHNYTDTTTSSTLSPTSNVAYNVDTAPDGWCTTDSAACDNQSRIRTDNTTNRATNNPNTNSGSMYSYGNYYNWYSATAGNGTYGFGTTNDSVAGDLCPAGWHLPKGGSSANATNSDFWQLGLGIMGAAPSNNIEYTNSETNAAGKTATAAFRIYPNNFVYSGYVNGGSVSDRGSYGTFWSSTAYWSNAAYSLALYLTLVDPGTSYNVKYDGRTVRCVAPGV